MNPSNPAAPSAPADSGQFGNYSQWAQEQLAKGFTPDQLHASLQSGGAPTQPAHSGNWLTHLLPTLGGIAGVLLAPETGGASLLATAGLSGLGAAGGKAIENATEGKQVFNGSDVTAGLEGAAGGALGGVAGKILGKAGSALGSQAEAKAAEGAADNAISDTATAYKDVSPQLQKLYNANDSVAHANAMGFDATKPGNLVDMANKSNDVLNSTLDKALANSGSIDLSHYPQLVKDALAKESGTLGSYEKVAMARGRLGYDNTPASKLLQQLENAGAGVAKIQSDPNEIRTLTTQLGRLAQDAKPTISAQTGAIDPVQRSTYNAINDVRDQLKNALYDRPEVNDALKAEVGNLTADDVGTQQLADHLNGIITQAGVKSPNAAQDLLTEISRNINVGNLGQEGLKAGQVVSSTGAQGRAAMEAGLTGSAPSTLDAVGHLANPHAGLINKALTTVAHAKDNPKILETLSRIGAMGDKLAPAAGVAMATSPNLGADPAAMPGGGAPGMAGGTMGGVMNQNANGGQFMGEANPNSMNSILSRMLYMGNVDPYLLSSTAPVVQALAPQVQRNSMLSSEMAGMPSLYANAGGAQGPSGILSRISGLIPGTAAHAYDQQANAQATQLAQVMGISPQAARGLLPSLMAGGQTAGLQSGILGSLSGQLAY